MSLVVLGGAVLCAALVAALWRPRPRASPLPSQERPSREHRLEQHARKRPHSEQIVEGALEYEVETGTLVLDRLGLRGARGELGDLARLDHQVREALQDLAELRVHVVVREEKLTLRWMGPEHRRELVTQQAHTLRKALWRAPRSARSRIQRMLESPALEDRRWLYERASLSGDPQRETILRKLMDDPDPGLAREVLRKHGTPEDLMNAALRGGTLAGRKEIVSWLQELPGPERCQAATQLALDPELHSELPRLIGKARGEEAERAWLALLERARHPDVLRQILVRLAEIGTRQSLPALVLFRDDTLSLHRTLQPQLSRTLDTITERCGAVRGALALAGPAESGALALAEDAGGRLAMPQKESP